DKAAPTSNDQQSQPGDSGHALFVLHMLCHRFTSGLTGCCEFDKDQDRREEYSSMVIPGT
ncbi:hypothetical protein, partial [Klebsiella pneumoniae]